MKIYFDESEDFNKTTLLLGAVFVYGDANINALRENIDKIKIKHNFKDSKGNLREIKYNKIHSPTDLNVAKEVIDLFFKSNNMYFRCCIVKWGKEDLAKFGSKDQPSKLKKAKLYTISTVKLLKLGIGKFRNVILLYDDLTRCRGDKFVEIIENHFTNCYKTSGPTIPFIKSSVAAKSDIKLNNGVQLVDLLTGCVLNNNFPSAKKKNQAREYLVQKLKKDLLEKSWSKVSRPLSEDTEKTKFYLEYIDINSLIPVKRVHMKKPSKMRKNRSW